MKNPDRDTPAFHIGHKILYSLFGDVISQEISEHRAIQLIKANKLIWYSMAGMSITAQQETRKETNQTYWYGYKHRDDKIYKVYICSNDNMSIHNLHMGCLRMAKKLGPPPPPPPTINNNLIKQYKLSKAMIWELANASRERPNHRHGEITGYKKTNDALIKRGLAEHTTIEITRYGNTTFKHTITILSKKGWEIVKEAGWDIRTMHD